MVDDCSSDRSVDIAASFCDKDDRIRLIRLNVNSGPAVARNTAIGASSKRYIAFLDSDDAWLPRKLEQQLAFMKELGAVLSHTWYGLVDEDGKEMDKTITPPAQLSYGDMLKSNQIGCLTAMYDSDRLGKVYMPLIRKRQDYGLWLRILRQSHYAYCLPERLALYRKRSGSISSNKIEMLRYNWNLYRTFEQLSVVKSAYYLGWNVARKVVR